MLGAAHKPGALPLRPLTLGNMYDGAFRIIRFNPKATVGAAVMVTAVAMLIPVVVTTVLTFTAGLAVDSSGELPADATLGDALGALAAYGSLLASMFLAQIGVVFVTGMIAHVTRAAAVGRRLSLGEAWAATHGKRWRLLGLTLLLNGALTALLVIYVGLWVVVVLVTQDPLPIVLWGLVTVPAVLALCAWLWIRLYYLPVPALMLEPVGVFGALGRGWTLTARQFWRTFGIALLTVIIANFAGSLLSTPFSLIGNLGALAVPEYTTLFLVLTQAVALLVSNAFAAPFQATVASVQYVDLRMRKEAFDVELMREAGIVPA
ncbi:hypothetical protein GUY44_21780 [Pimelobacter simplex]|uniref:Putative integral membrane protein n=1 Tax=Nocardioides simplex TaxID=2045 RepID=A0A0A1DMU0_NOCSI|nr:hypothetical protein [Pimelobacter simplex]AIY18674.1 putative integral membrane protein [Pimelobacter simplex]MCG8153126.1 hypothetical protein [Pimelobacter simplex]GEB14333.1 hypothetical protein NSI01_26480 [Pimelobacter simplex]SFM30950.1 hypothetical protein SAMN05421671_1086 [Pimelobacter simplex]